MYSNWPKTFLWIFLWGITLFLESASIRAYVVITTWVSVLCRFVVTGSWNSGRVDKGVPLTFCLGGKFIRTPGDRAQHWACEQCLFFFFFFVLRPAAVFQNMTTQRGRDYEYELVLKINRWRAGSLQGKSLRAISNGSGAILFYSRLWEASIMDPSPTFIC